MIKTQNKQPAKQQDSHFVEFSAWGKTGPSKVDSTCISNFPFKVLLCNCGHFNLRWMCCINTDVVTCSWTTNTRSPLDVTTISIQIQTVNNWILSFGLDNDCEQKSLFSDHTHTVFPTRSKTFAYIKDRPPEVIGSINKGKDSHPSRTTNTANQGGEHHTDEVQSEWEHGFLRQHTQKFSF